MVGLSKTRHHSKSFVFRKFSKATDKYLWANIV